MAATRVPARTLKDGDRFDLNEIFDYIEKNHQKIGVRNLVPDSVCSRSKHELAIMIGDAQVKSYGLFGGVGAKLENSIHTMTVPADFIVTKVS